MQLKISLESENKGQAIKATDRLEEHVKFYLPEAKVERSERLPGPGEAPIGAMAAAVLIYIGKKSLDKLTDVVWDWIKNHFKNADTPSKDASSQKGKTIKIELDNDTGTKTIITVETIQDAQKMILTLKSLNQ